MDKVKITIKGVSQGEQLQKIMDLLISEGLQFETEREDGN